MTRNTKNTNRNKKIIDTTKKAKKELYTGWKKKEYCNGDVYNGDFKSDRRDGFGKMSFNLEKTNCKRYDWITYDGAWKRGEPHGYGRMDFSDGSYCTGMWKKGYISRGRFIYADGHSYWGDFAEMYYRDLFHVTPYRNGLGIMFRKNGNQVFSGDWMADPIKFSLNSMPPTEKHGLPHGRGTYRFVNNEEFFGKWNKGVPTDKGLYYRKNGETELKEFPKNKNIEWLDSMKDRR